MESKTVGKMVGFGVKHTLENHGANCTPTGRANHSFTSFTQGQSQGKGCFTERKLMSTVSSGSKGEIAPRTIDKSHDGTRDFTTGCNQFVPFTK